MTHARKWLFAALLGTTGLVATSAADGQIVSTSADPTATGRYTVTEVAYRPAYARRGYYGGYGGYYRPYRAPYGPQYGYGGRWGANYRPYYSSGVYSYPSGYGYGYGNRPYYGYRYARPAYRYGW